MGQIPLKLQCCLCPSLPETIEPIAQPVATSAIISYQIWCNVILSRPLLGNARQPWSQFVDTHGCCNACHLDLSSVTDIPYLAFNQMPLVSSSHQLQRYLHHLQSIDRFSSSKSFTVHIPVMDHLQDGGGIECGKSLVGVKIKVWRHTGVRTGINVDRCESSLRTSANDFITSARYDLPLSPSVYVSGLIYLKPRTVVQLASRKSYSNCRKC